MIERILNTMGLQLKTQLKIQWLNHQEQISAKKLELNQIKYLYIL